MLHSFSDESDLNAEEVARTLSDGEVPDKHHDATKFMRKLSSDLVGYVKAKLPAKATAMNQKLAAHERVQSCHSKMTVQTPKMPKGHSRADALMNPRSNET